MISRVTTRTECQKKDVWRAVALSPQYWCIQTLSHHAGKALFASASLPECTGLVSMFNGNATLFTPVRRERTLVDVLLEDVAVYRAIQKVSDETSRHRRKERNSQRTSLFLTP